ncbi:MarR family transcriptional regulator [Iningainema tapete]|uniref:MarR family transcriptional regulator n=1 Tax=Iningainema tapete BLCC-T55 TaxID=2748662 RepID=A0A8J7C444_9CYAN|nr:MarR family transcriptional regulator [Iningainema tapete]MBD2770924.1 MarR family transcriptional regulator [Iningainema tapete BLCC-T55]
MSGLDNQSLGDSSRQSQEPILNQIERSSSTVSATDIANLLSIDELRLVLIVAENNGITAKKIAEELYRSRANASKLAKQVVQKEVITFIEKPSKKTGILPTHEYYLAHGITKDMIVSAIEIKDNSGETPNFINTGESLSLNDLGSINLKNPINPTFLKECLLGLPLILHRTLRVVPTKGITAFEAANLLKCTTATSNKKLKKLWELGWLIRKKLESDNGTSGEYCYFLASSLTPDLLNTAFATLRVKTIKKPMYDNYPEKEMLNQKEQEPSLEIETTDPQAEIVIAKVNQLMTHIRQAKALKEELRAIGGRQAEELIANLEAENF